MAEELAAVQDQVQEPIPYQIKIEDAGPATKKVSIEIPPEVIASKLEEQFKSLRREAAVPGFRTGHVPQKLIEKRFAGDVRDQVRRNLISESYEQAVQKHSLRVIGEPQFDDPEAIKLPESGSLTYSFEVEVQPDFVLPPLVGLKVKKPKVQIKDEHIDQALMNLRQQQGALVPVEDRAVEAGDYLLADVHVKLDGNVVSHQHDAQIVARPGRVAGIQIDDLDAKLEGLKTGESRQFKLTAPETHAEEKMRGKEVEIDIAIKDIKKLELAEITKEFLDSLGFANESELRDALREQMLERIQYDIQQSMREQINNYLLHNVHFDLPAKLSEKQAERVAQRRALDLMMRGVPREQVEARTEQLRGAAKDEALRDLKLFFILQKIAGDQNVDVTEPELNGRIAMLAAQAGKRPEKVKQEMTADGSLLSLYVQMREQKALDKIIADAQVEEVDIATLEDANKNEAAQAPSATAEPAQDEPAKDQPPQDEPPKDESTQKE